MAYAPSTADREAFHAVIRDARPKGVSHGTALAISKLLLWNAQRVASTLATSRREGTPPPPTTQASVERLIVLSAKLGLVVHSNLTSTPPQFSIASLAVPSYKFATIPTR